MSESQLCPLFTFSLRSRLRAFRTVWQIAHGDCRAGMSVRQSKITTTIPSVLETRLFCSNVSRFLRISAGEGLRRLADVLAQRLFCWRDLWSAAAMIPEFPSCLGWPNFAHNLNFVEDIRAMRKEISVSNLCELCGLQAHKPDTGSMSRTLRYQDHRQCQHRCQGGSSRQTSSC